MSTELESVAERALRQGVAAAGGLSFKLIATVRGLPDRLVVLPGGRIFLVELKKAETGRLSEVQKHRIAQLQAVGVPVAVLAGVAEVEDWLARHVYRD